MRKYPLMSSAEFTSSTDFQTEIETLSSSLRPLIEYLAKFPGEQPDGNFSGRYKHMGRTILAAYVEEFGICTLWIGETRQRNGKEFTMSTFVYINKENEIDRLETKYLLPGINRSITLYDNPRGQELAGKFRVNGDRGTVKKLNRLKSLLEKLDPVASFAPV